MQRALTLIDWLIAHQDQCWQFLSRDTNAKQMKPLEKAIAEIIVEHADDIASQGGYITNADLLKAIHSRQGFSNVSSEQLGKAATSLGLGTDKKHAERVRIVTTELIEKFRDLVQHVRPVQENHQASPQEGIIIDEGLKEIMKDPVMRADL